MIRQFLTVDDVRYKVLDEYMVEYGYPGKIEVIVEPVEPIPGKAPISKFTLPMWWYTADYTCGIRLNDGRVVS